MGLVRNLAIKRLVKNLSVVKDDIKIDHKEIRSEGVDSSGSG